MANEMNKPTLKLDTATDTVHEEMRRLLTDERRSGGANEPLNNSLYIERPEGKTSISYHICVMARTVCARRQAPTAHSVRLTARIHHKARPSSGMYKSKILRVDQSHGVTEFLKSFSETNRRGDETVRVEEAIGVR